LGSGPCPGPGPWGQVLVLVLGGQVLVLVLVLGSQVLVLVLVLGGQVLVLVLVLGGQVLVNIPVYMYVHVDLRVCARMHSRIGLYRPIA
jgi:hypothetical protein